MSKINKYHNIELYYTKKKVDDGTSTSTNGIKQGHKL